MTDVIAQVKKTDPALADRMEKIQSKMKELKASGTSPREAIMSVEKEFGKPTDAEKATIDSAMEAAGLKFPSHRIGAQQGRERGPQETPTHIEAQYGRNTRGNDQTMTSTLIAPVTGLANAALTRILKVVDEAAGTSKTENKVSGLLMNYGSRQLDLASLLQSLTKGISGAQNGAVASFLQTRNATLD